ncbi:MAG: CmcI family methyltransferase [Calothrix sp. MO_192.B10]|nr:CmcI family methyltransferase [Calothrix sp. MO_192.B10]
MNYQNILQQARHKQEPLKPERFVKISDRKDKCDIPTSAFKPLFENAYLQTWKGIILNKGITEIALYPMLVYELQPKTIIEIGAFNGGGAIWLADHLDLFEIEGHVYSVDIDLSLLDEKARNDSRVHFLEGDCNNINAVFPPQMLSELPHPWLIIEDAHVNLVAVVEYFHSNGLQSGDYLIVEDTNRLYWELWGDNWDDRAEMEQGVKKMDDLRNWLIDHEKEYLVDTYYQDLYGYNGSKNWNSILKRV